MARGYDAAVGLGRFGPFERFYRAVAAELEARPGSRVLDLGCGPGAGARHLLPTVGTGGSVVGVDVSDEMIERARARARREGWRNAEFVRADASEFTPEGSFDAVVCCLSLTTLPDPERCLARALSWLAPAGRLVVLDSLPEAARPLARLVIRAKAPWVGAAPSERLLPVLRESLDDVRVRRFQLGVYTLVSGRKPF
jgi:ubiquinone/menaquinone biosynthesis C-methylase UbiE